MTDYASQGRTRHVNVVHLEHCRGFLSIYTCLSRSSSLNGTLILGPLDSSKITGGLSGALRQEFKELELLDDITSRRFHNELPPQTNTSSRAVLLPQFLKMQGPEYMPPHLHNTLK
ncbi:hypothetical protein BDW22DRAFT_1333396, partial [Trametopsis cervina]